MSAIDLRMHEGLQAYFAATNHGLLSAEEEHDLSTRAREGDQEARAALIERNLRLAAKIAASYQRRGLAYEDLIQEANLGLMRAIETFDPERARLHLGPLLPALLRDYLVCDTTARVVLERQGTLVHVFARRRTVDDRLRTLIDSVTSTAGSPGAGGGAGCTSTTWCTTRTGA